MRPSTFHAPGLDVKTNATIKKILNRWAKHDEPRKDAKPKKRK